MNIPNRILLILIFLLPLGLSAGETSKGTIVLISGASAWVCLTSGVLFYKEWRRIRAEKDAANHKR